jgi:hypothetical protein
VQWEIVKFLLKVIDLPGKKLDNRDRMIGQSSGGWIHRKENGK